MVWFIDTENVNVSKIKLKDNQQYILLYRNTASGKPPKLIQKVQAQNKSNIVCHRAIGDTKNCVDFYIVSMISQMITSMPEEKFGIVSNDRGYLPVATYWKDIANINITLRHVNNTR
jgi:hypothetical protein